MKGKHKVGMNDTGKITDEEGYASFKKFGKMHCLLKGLIQKKLFCDILNMLSE